MKKIVGNGNLFFFLTAALVCAALVLPAQARDQEAAAYPPLFDVGLDFDFPDAKQTFENTKELILKNYYTTAVSEEALYWAAIQGMLRHVSPPGNPELARIWTSEEYESILQSLLGVQVTIGIKSSFNPAAGSLTVTKVLPDSPAEDILLPQDQILRIDEQSLKKKTTRQLNELLDGPEGSSVTLTVLRDIKVFDVTLKRRKMETPDLVVTHLAGQVGLVEIKKFSDGVSRKLKPQLKKLAEQGVTKLIIDLRNDQGGVFIEGLRVAELFVPNKRIMLRVQQRRDPQKAYVSANDEPFDFEIAVLVNKNTASASEILAEALRDNRRAFIVGYRTYGKGVFETTFTLDQGFRVKFITGAMYSPLGKSWQGKGVVPDFLVEQNDRTLASVLRLEPKERLKSDVALITAYKLLLK